jgi:anti-anti-sigma regulatory factor
MRATRNGGETMAATKTATAKTVAARSVVEVGRTAEGFLLRIVGRGTMRESLAFHDHVIDCLVQESIKLAVDLDECNYLDSTFLGCLVNLHRRLGADRLLLVACEERRRQLLSAMKLDRLFSTIDSPPETIGSTATLSAEVLDSRDLGRHTMQCHRELAKLGGPNQAIFERIAEQLEQELNAE